MKEAAELLRVSEWKVYRMAAADEIPTLRRVGVELRFDMDALEAWLRQEAS